MKRNIPFVPHQQQRALSAQEQLDLALDYHQRGQLAQAEKVCRDFLYLRPDSFRALHLLGIILLSRGQLLEAATFLRRAVKVAPGEASVHNNLGVVLRDLGQFDEALASYDKALALNPDYVDALNNRGVVLTDLLRYDEALSAYDKVLEMTSGLADVHSNRGTVLQELRRFAEALDAYATAVQIDPGYADAHWNESRCHLLLGDYLHGWQKYEWRWQRPRFTSRKREFPAPLWLGNTPLEGKTILLHAEQGLGDTIQCLRYVPLVKARGGRIILEVQAALRPLLAGYPGVDCLLAADEALPTFDFHCPLFSLPLAFKTELQSIPWTGPYITSDLVKREYWRGRLSATPGVKVGLVWSGNPAQQDNHLRSIKLEALMPLASNGVQLVSLQKELRSDEERQLVLDGALLHFGDQLEDFSDTAALIDCVDVVVSVCTSVAHLAGAMGKPVWVMLQRSHDWRWLLDRDDSPWYPSARLYRQDEARDWSGVITRVSDDLLARPAISASER